MVRLEVAYPFFASSAVRGRKRHAALLARLRCVAACTALLLALFAHGLALAQVPIPKLATRVTDLTNTLTAEQRQALETRLGEFEARKGAQLAVLLVPTTQPETIEQYARRVLDEWKLGRKDIDDGALLLIAIEDRRLRIETQYGLEGVLPDATAKRIVDTIITPRFRQKDFYGGISAGVERMIAVIDGEPLPAPSAKPAPRGGAGDVDIGGLLMLGFALVFVVGSVLRRMMGRVGGAAVTAGIGGGISWLMIGSAIAAAGVGLLLFILSLLISFGGLSRMGNHRSRGWGSPWGGGWGGGGGSWGGGGWSGGGGMGGGGGASGSW